MPLPSLTRRSLGELSRIEVRYLVGRATRQPYLSVLVVQYAGTYPIGSKGNVDARYMAAMARAGVMAFEACGVIHDLSELAYEWGDMLEAVFAVGPVERSERAEAVNAIFGDVGVAAQQAVVVGPGCEDAVRTLLLGINSDEPIESIGYVFRDLASAWEFVDGQILD